MNLPDRGGNLWMCPEVRERIQEVYAGILMTGVRRVTCGRCNTVFDVTVDGAFPVADFCVSGLSQLTLTSKVDGT